MVFLGFELNFQSFFDVFFCQVLKFFFFFNLKEAEN